MESEREDVVVVRQTALNGIALLLALALPAHAREPSEAQVSADFDRAPYVTSDANGNWSLRQRLAAGDTLIVPAIASFPPFTVPLRQAAAQPDPGVLPIPSSIPLFVMADTHGEFEIAATLLLRQGVIDAELRWSFGRGHLVVTGDMLDRGPHQIELLWLLYALEAQAAEAGGGVHVLIGNHEAMVLRDDLRYLNPRYPATASALGAGSYAEMLGPQTLLGQWLRRKPAILRLGDTLFLHGGVSPELVASGLTIASINEASRRVLEVPVSERDRLTETEALIAGPNGPLWYRGYFPDIPGFTPATEADVDASLRHFGASRVFVGHTPVPTITPLFGGRVIATQVYPRREEGTGAFIMEGAIRENGAWQSAHADGTRGPFDRRH